MAAACGDNMGSGRDGGGGNGDGDGDGGSSLADAAGADADPGDLGPADGDLCATPDDCAGGSVCDPDQSETSGTCSTTPCTVGDDSTCAPAGDGTCVDLDGDGGDDPRCLDPCEEAGDCDTGQRCDEAGDDDVDGTFCRHAEVGDPCADADSCGGDPWLCVTESEFGAGTQEWTEGYCSLPCTGGCPTGTVCNDRIISDGGDSFCVVECEGVLDDCERDPDYECQDVNAAGGPANVTFGCAPPIL